MQRKGYSSVVTVPIIVTVMVSLVATGIVEGMISNTTQKASTPPKDDLDAVSTQLNQECESVVASNNKGDTEKTYVFEEIVTLEVDGKELIAEYDSGKRQIADLEEDCEYSWSGISTQESKWLIETSSETSSNPGIKISATRK